jgi:hypothetical protein
MDSLQDTKKDITNIWSWHHCLITMGDIEDEGGQPLTLAKGGAPTSQPAKRVNWSLYLSVSSVYLNSFAVVKLWARRCYTSL